MVAMELVGSSLWDGIRRYRLFPVVFAWQGNTMIQRPPSKAYMCLPCLMTLRPAAYYDRQSQRDCHDRGSRSEWQAFFLDVRFLEQCGSLVLHLVVAKPRRWANHGAR